jgi:hypothetical protein
MAEPATAAEVARTVADALDRHGLPYAIGGAIALGFHAVPRATVDVDVNIFVPPADQLSRALTALAAAGFVADEDKSRLQARASVELVVVEDERLAALDAIERDVDAP